MRPFPLIVSVVNSTRRTISRSQMLKGFSPFFFAVIVQEAGVALQLFLSFFRAQNVCAVTKGGTVLKLFAMAILKNGVALDCKKSFFSLKIQIAKHSKCTKRRNCGLPLERPARPWDVSVPTGLSAARTNCCILVLYPLSNIVTKLELQLMHNRLSERINC